MKKGIQHLLIAWCCLILVPACTNPINFGIDLYELAHFQQDGSGKFEIVFSLNKACKLIALGEYVAQVHIKFVRLLITEAFVATSKNLKKIPGISQVTVKHGANMLHFKLAFSFQDMQALNKAMNSLYLGVDPPGMIYFAMKKHIFVRKDTKSLNKLVAAYKNVDDSLIKSFDIDFFFRNMRHIVKYSFQIPINKVSNPLANISSNRQAIMMIHYPFRKKDKHASMANTLLFKQALDKKIKP